jgi:hypothetical protein
LRLKKPVGHFECPTGFYFLRGTIYAEREKKPMRHVDPHRQYAFSQSAGTTVYLVKIARDVQ